MSEIRLDTQDIKNHLLQQEMSAAHKIELKEREKTLKWLSRCTFETEFREFDQNWLPETCKWVCSHQYYKQWDDADAGAFQNLWIFGNPGCGKTFLSHSIRRKLSQEGSIVAYFYFNSKQDDTRKQSANAFYRTIIYQLLQALEGKEASASSYSIAHQLRRHTGDNNSITIESLLNTLKGILIKIGTRVTIIIDALDECKEDDQEFVERTVLLGRDVRSLKVVITSRPGLNIVDRYYKIASKIDIDLHVPRTESNHDINLYIEKRLKNSETLGDEMFPDMTQEIRKKLRKNADGMFLYVRLMLDMLEQHVTEEGIRDALERVPGGLAGLYEGIIQKIEKNASKDLGEIARRVLRWVAAAQRPMTVDGLMMALRAEKLDKVNPKISDLGPLIPNYRERLWQICSPLLEVREDDTVQMIHGSLGQHLLGRPHSVTVAGGGHDYFRYMSPEEHFGLASTCLTYLLAQPPKPDGFSRIDEYSGRFVSCTSYNAYGYVKTPEEFFAYATLEWPWHCRMSEAHSGSYIRDERILKFVLEQNRFESWIVDIAAFDRAFATYFRLEIGSGVQITDQLPSPIHICAYFGLGKLSVQLLYQGAGALDRQDATGRKPVHIAAERDFADLVGTYLDQGEQARKAKQAQGGSYYQQGRTIPKYGLGDSRDGSGKTALHLAAARGNRLSVIRLLQSGFSPDTPDDLGQTPLLLAALSGHKDVVLELSKKPESLTCASKSGLTPLDCLIERGHEEILKSLLLSGKLPEVWLKSSHLAFITAARKGFIGVVLLLLRAKIDANARDDLQQTALHKAATWGHIEIVELLLGEEGGADINAEDQSKKTPLHLAAAGGHMAVVKFLIEVGASVDALDKNNQTILFEPAGRGHTEIVKELLGAGVGAKLVDDRDRSALHFASRYGRKGVAELLLNAGVDLHGEEREKETPLHWAAQHGQDMMIEQLISAGAKLEARDVQGRTPLHHGAWRGMQASVYALLRYGSAPDVVDLNERTPLYWGVLSGNLDVVQSLLGAGANITAGDMWGITPLHIAARHGHDAILKRLLDTGPSLETRDHLNATPLHFATREGQQSATKLLLDAGASPTAIDFKRRTPTWKIRSEGEGGLDGVVSLLNEAKEKAESKYLSLLPSIHQAAKKGEDANLRNLIAAGTNVDEKDARGRSALHWAALEGHEAIFLRLVLGAGANIHLSDNSGQTALHLGTGKKHLALVRQCLVAGADAMVKDSYGQVPLHLAVLGGQRGVVAQLLESAGSQAGVNVADNWSRTPLHLAAEGGSKEIVVGLLAYGASTVNSGDFKGQTPLHRAARNGHLDVVKELITAGAKLDVADNNKRTALHLAAKYGHHTVVEQLLEAGDNVAA